jgi:hypothetical protein
MKNNFLTELSIVMVSTSFSLPISRAEKMASIRLGGGFAAIINGIGGHLW